MWRNPKNLKSLPRIALIVRATEAFIPQGVSAPRSRGDHLAVAWKRERRKEVSDEHGHLQGDHEPLPDDGRGAPGEVPRGLRRRDALPPQGLSAQADRLAAPGPRRRRPLRAGPAARRGTRPPGVALHPAPGP